MDSFTLDKVEFNEIRRILAEFCSCSLGKDLALRISPSRSPQIIQKWLAQVTQMEDAIRMSGLPPFGGVADIAGPLERAAPGGGACGEDFVAIASTLEGAGNVKRYIENLGEQFPLLHELAGGIEDFSSEIAAIWSILSSDGTVKDSASIRLAEIRRQIQGTAQQIHDVIYGYLRNSEVAKLLQNITVTLHGDRYVLPVKAENRGRLAGVVHRESNTGSTVFVEPAQCVELNNKLSDLLQDERNEVQRLLNHLAIRISARTAHIVPSLRALAQVDLVSGKAQYSYQFEMTCPEIAEHGRLQVNKARHPLLIEQARRQELAGVRPQERLKVVPIDIRLGSDFDILVITGSNTGGKTVALKTVAALVLMAQSGMHVPAGRGSVLPIFHDVLIDVGDEQSLQQSLSTFGAHVKRLRYILSKAGRSSLVLLDELGSGTDPDEGGAIGQAVLDELRGLGCLGMVTTHLSVLKAYAFANERVDNASVEFDTATLSPTYHLLIGQPGESHAITVAQKLGLPHRVVGAAKGYLSTQGKQFRRAIRATNEVRRLAEAARSEAQAAQVQALSQQEMYQARLSDVQELREQFNHWLARLSQMKPGDELFVPSLKRTGRLVRLELHRQIALVDSESLQVEVPLGELMPDLGQSGVRQQIEAIRRQMLDEAKLAQDARVEATRMKDEYHRSLLQQKERARQFDTWLSAIARLKVGDEVPVSIRPGKATVLNVDLPGLRATVHIGDEEKTLPLQELFPQTGPFAQLGGRPAHGGPGHGEHRRGGGDQRRADQSAAASRTAGQGPRDGGQVQGDRKVEPQSDRPMHRGDAQTRAARVANEAVLKLSPGQQVFVVPFNKRATLIRFRQDGRQAIVQSGIFEMQVPVSDLEIIRDQPPAQKEKAKDKHRSRPQPVGPSQGDQGEASQEQSPQQAAERPPAE